MLLPPGRNFNSYSHVSSTDTFTADFFGSNDGNADADADADASANVSIPCSRRGLPDRVGQAF
jgi:hypothetical protein